MEPNVLVVNQAFIQSVRSEPGELVELSTYCEVQAFLTGTHHDKSTIKCSPKNVSVLNTLIYITWQLLFLQHHFIAA